MTGPHREIGIQPLVNWPRTVEAGHSYQITVDLRLTDPGAWPYDEEELVVGCMIDGRPACRVLALGDAGVILHRFGGSYGPAQFLAEVPEGATGLADAALWLTLTTAGGVPFYTGKLPMNGSAVFAEDLTADHAATEVGEGPRFKADTPDRSGTIPVRVADGVPEGGIARRASDTGTRKPAVVDATPALRGGLEGQDAADTEPRDASWSWTGASPEAFTVRILGRDGSVAGLGMLVADRQVVTCAHVVNAALGQASQAQDLPGGTVLVDFPLAGSRHPRVEAGVAAWVPPAEGDIAGLELMERAPDGTRPGKLAAETPRHGNKYRVFGYPQRQLRPEGMWATATGRGYAAGGRIQLESGPGPALENLRGFSGSPLFDHTTGRVAGLVSVTGGPGGSRLIYATAADRLRLAWPEVLAGRWQRSHPGAGLTILHISDIQWGRDYLFGGNGRIPASRAKSTLSQMLRDMESLGDEHDLHPDLVIVTGGLTGSGSPSEYRQVSEFLTAISEVLEVPRRHIAIIPGSHDLNKMAAQAYFADAEAREATPVYPYWPKWANYAGAFNEFYSNVPGAAFTPDEPWSLFAMPDLGVVVAGLNSTIADSHRDQDHYGYLGDTQLRWFADRLAAYKAQGWLRLAAVHHNVSGGAALAEENLRDTGNLDRILGQPGLVNLLLHGHPRDGTVNQLRSGLPVLSSGSSAVGPSARPTAIPSQYQLITVRPDGITRHARQYSADQALWIGDTRISATGSDWRDSRSLEMTDIDRAFPPAGTTMSARQVSAEDEPPVPNPSTSQGAFLERVAEATRARYPHADIAMRPGGRVPYLRVTQTRPGGIAEQWPVGVVDGAVTEAMVTEFADGVHAQFTAADPQVQSELVYRGEAAGDHLVRLARQRGVRLRSLISYQGLLDLLPLDRAQRERLAADPIYAGRFYVEQRYRVAEGDGGRLGDIRTGLITQAVEWLGADEAQLVVVLGDFGRGKTSFLRQLTRVLPAELPGLQPILVELRSLEKAPNLELLLVSHLVSQGVEDINPAKLEYMINSGRIALLLDGFDELELRVGYDNAADYLQLLLASVTDQAKIVLTSRTQHFRSTGQVLTALGDQVSSMAASRVVLLEDFSLGQVTEFLTRLYDNDAQRARERLDLIGDIGNLLDLAHNPRMLAFMAELEADRLAAVRSRAGQMTAADLYHEIIDFWLTGESGRQTHDRGLRTITKEERFAACTALALRLWRTASPTVSLRDLSAEVATVLSSLAESGYRQEQAAHTIGSSSLLVRAEDGVFAFIHPSIMEWLVANYAAGTPGEAGQILQLHQMSRVMVDFYTGLAGQEAAYQWAGTTLRDPSVPEAARQNALAILAPSRESGSITQQELSAPAFPTAPAPPEAQHVPDQDRLEHGRRSRRRTARGSLLPQTGVRTPLVRDISDPVSVGVHSAARRDAGGRVPTYVPRDGDPALLAALTRSGFVLVAGDAAVGKTRMAYEAMRTVLPGHVFIAPGAADDAAAAMAAARSERDCVLWLDNLERFLGVDGVTSRSIAELLAGSRHHRVVLATLRVAEESRFLAAAESLPGVQGIRDAWAVLGEVTNRIVVERLFSEAERTRAVALSSSDPRIADALRHVHQFGMAEYLACGPQLHIEWADAWGRGAHPRGASLVAAAIDCRLAGFTAPVPRALLEELQLDYLDRRGGMLLRPEPLRDAWKWATTLRDTGNSLLRPAEPDSYEVFDYLVDVHARDLDQPVPERTVRAALRFAGPANATLIGATAYSQDRRDLAEVGFRKAYTELLRTEGPDAPATLASRSDLAVTLHTAGDLPGAETEYREILQKRTESLGPEHPDTLASRNNMATLLHALVRLSEAEAEYRAILAIRMRTLGAEHPSTLLTRNNLGVVLKDLGRLEEAKAVLKEVVRLRTLVLGQDHPHTVISRENLSIVRRQRPAR
jgi:3',5'-cyclic AMP phosphodiesterase CpdA